jgi:hypothetical protein
VCLSWVLPRPDSKRGFFLAIARKQISYWLIFDLDQIFLVVIALYVGFWFITILVSAVDYFGGFAKLKERILSFMPWCIRDFPLLNILYRLRYILFGRESTNYSTIWINRISWVGGTLFLIYSILITTYFILDLKSFKLLIGLLTSSDFKDVFFLKLDLGRSSARN